MTSGTWPGWGARGVAGSGVGEDGGADRVRAEAVAGAVRGLFGGSGAVVGGVEGELVVGVGGGAEPVGAQGVAADAGALQAEGVQEDQGGGGEVGGVGGGFGQGAGPGGGGAVGVAEGEGEVVGGVGGVAQAGAEFLGEAEDGAAVLVGVEGVVFGEVVGGQVQGGGSGVTGRGSWPWARSASRRAGAAPRRRWRVAGGRSATSPMVVRP